MALTALILGFLLAILLIFTSQSLTCTSQSFTNNLYDCCSDLTQLSSYFHWTTNSSNSTLSITFIATPDRSNSLIS
ncbi:hypothetical protein CsSME_00011789 [Camellia sinensis var. sinensis]